MPTLTQKTRCPQGFRHLIWPKMFLMCGLLCAQRASDTCELMSTYLLHACVRMQQASAVDGRRHQLLRVDLTRRLRLDHRSSPSCWCRGPIKTGHTGSVSDETGSSVRDMFSCRSAWPHPSVASGGRPAPANMGHRGRPHTGRDVRPGAVPDGRGTFRSAGRQRGAGSADRSPHWHISQGGAEPPSSGLGGDVSVSGTSCASWAMVPFLYDIAPTEKARQGPAEPHTQRTSRCPGQTGFPVAAVSYRRRTAVKVRATGRGRSERASAMPESWQGVAQGEAWTGSGGRAAQARLCQLRSAHRAG
jgi:hypothetical protein